MTELSALIGMEEREGCEKLDREGKAWVTVRYRAFRSSTHWDSARIVRVNARDDIIELVTCEFKTKIERNANSHNELDWAGACR